jgi:exopolysaccharide biosynthesis protein
MAETAAVAKALDLSDAINLDGGGSTAMAVDGALVSHPSGTNGAERAVGDALIWVPKK